jgi:hypothetical protein
MKKIILSIYFFAVAQFCVAQATPTPPQQPTPPPKPAAVPTPARSVLGRLEGLEALGGKNDDDEPKEVIKKTYKTKFSEGKKIVINIESSVVSIEGYNGDEVIIEAENPPQAPKEAEGLRPLSAGGTDNTGLGIAANTNGGVMTVNMILKPKNTYKNGQRDLSTKYKFKVPSGVNVSYKQGNEWCSCDDKNPLAISNIDGEVEVRTNDTYIVLKDVTGPIVARSNNGKIKVIYDEKISEKPSSFVTYDGSIDITVSEKAKVAFGINTSFYGSRSNVFTDLDLKVMDEKPKVTETKKTTTKPVEEAYLKPKISNDTSTSTNVLEIQQKIEEVKAAQNEMKEKIAENHTFEPASWAGWDNNNNNKMTYVLNEGKTQISIRTNNGNVFLRKK